MFHYKKKIGDVSDFNSLSHAEEEIFDKNKTQKTFQSQLPDKRKLKVLKE